MARPVRPRAQLPKLICWLAALLCACVLAGQAQAQTINQYTNITSGAIVDSTNCATTVTRTFTVGSSYTVGDVDLGVFLTHTYRSDLRITLTSPAASNITVNIMTNTAGSGDNLNDLFNDEASSPISAHDANGTDSTSAPPPYAHGFQPSSVLSAFDGINAAGTWTMVICDSVAQDVGTFSRADLYITERPANFADLSLTKTVSNAAPANGANITYTLTVANSAASNLTATGVGVLDTLPLGVTFVSASGTGTYNSGTGIWTVGSLAPGASASITLTVTVTATSGATVTNGAEVRTSSAADIDSTPANNSTTEDDNASVAFTVSGTRVAGTPPTLNCPSGTTVHDWDSVAWAAGTTSTAYPIANIGSTTFAITKTGGSWLNNATYGGQSPARQNAVTGGFSPAQFSIFELINFGSISESATTTITLPTAVPGAQFRIFDVDFTAGQFADKITVVGSYNGATVIPTVTNGVSNYVIGNSAIGDATSGDSSANGNIVVTFASAVDTISIIYTNHTTAPADPGQQAIALHDITFCRPVATLSVTKISSVLDDYVSGSNPKAIPGALIRYCITMTNGGSGTTTLVSATDSMPANMTYVAGSMASGTSCGSAGTAEDDDASGADETDPFGMSISGSTITGSAASLAPNASFAMVFNATVD